MHFAALFTLLVIWIIAKICDDGSRYLCPRCSASLRPYVQSCRYCRARFKVQPMTAPTRQGVLYRPLFGCASRPVLPRPAAPPDPETLKACFHLPERGHYERAATLTQKRELEKIGATNFPAIDALGEEQAQYLIKFCYSLGESQAQAREAARVKAARRKRLQIAAAVCAAVVVTGIVVLGLAHATGQTASDQSSPEKSAVVAETIPAQTIEQTSSPTPALAPAKTTTVSYDSAAVVAAPSPSTAPVNKVDFEALVNASKRRAIRNHPMLGVAGSHYNAAFVARYNQLLKSHNARLEAADWPERLADDCARDLPGNYQY